MAEDTTLRQLQRVDPEACAVLAKARHVVVFSFKVDATGKDVWEKDKIEGTLFLFRRKVEPKYSICVLNRVTAGDLCQPLKFGSSDFEYEFNKTFLIYRIQGAIRCIWLNESEVGPVKEAIEACDREVLSVPPVPKYVSRAGNGDTLLTVDELRDSLLRLIGNDQFMHSLYDQYIASEQKKRTQPAPPQVSPLRQPTATPPHYQPPPFMTPQRPQQGLPPGSFPMPPNMMYASAQTPYTGFPQQAPPYSQKPV